MNSKKQNLDVTIQDNAIFISRNFEEPLIIANPNNKNMLALFDSIINPGKYILNVHDLRNKEVFSKISFSVDSEYTV